MTKRFEWDNALGKVYDYDKPCEGTFISYHEWEIVDLMNELNDENEQLKKAIAETEKIVQSTYDELTKLRCFKKNILRIKYSWDHLMEAIQYD